MPKSTEAYRYLLRFNVAQLDLVSRLMARTGLSLASVIRLALSTLADKLGEPVQLPRAGKLAHGPFQQAAKLRIDEGMGDSGPAPDLGF